MISLLIKYRDHYSFIHLNGNSHKQFTKDKHTIPLNDESIDQPLNLIENFDKLLNFVSKINVICILELHYKNYEYYKKLAEKYGFELVSEKIHDNN